MVHWKKPRQHWLVFMTLNMCKIFSLVPSKETLAKETDTIKSWTILQNFCSRILRFTIKPLGTLAKIGIFIQKLKFFFKLLGFLLCQFLYWVYFMGTRENILHIIRALLTLLTRNQSYFLKNSDQKSTMNIFYLIIDMFFFSKWIVIAWASAKGLNRLFAMVDSIRVKKYV